MSQDIDKVKEIIAKSGNSFHFKVLKHLESLGWKTIISPYYNDNLTSKPREIDLIAEKAFVTKDRFEGFTGTVNVQLFIECKYISQKTVFWFHDKNMKQAEELITNNTQFRKDNSYTQQHHYLDGKDRAAKLFADEKSKAAENEAFYKALNQSLNALIYYRNKGSIIKLPSGRDGYVRSILTFPVIICNNFENLYQVDLHVSEEPSKINDDFHLEINYAYLDVTANNQNEYFLIDIVNFEMIDSFLEKIEKDADLNGFFLQT